ncbi:facilitated trehalose transporter Tret1-like isoform X1 [Planococcus citri]|uniref:facilitated trehalose transporter Tret1-like isoform X1 n=1 Tax=Planococcus citri TaxID=170843 RepID=UPI0031F808BA
MDKYRENFHHSLAMLTVFFNEFCSGMGTGWISPTLNALKSADSTSSMTIAEFSWIASIDQFGRIVGCILAAIFLDMVGRKPILISSALTFCLTWIILMFTKSVYMICVVRVLFGVALGLESGTNSVYIGENLSPRVRGFFGTISLALYDIGMFMEVVIATYFSFRTTAIINFFIQFIFFSASYWVRETAPFLLMKGDEKKALENFMWLKGVTEPDHVKNEFEQIKLHVQAEKAKKASIRKIITSRANYRSVVILVMIYILGGMTGYVTIMAYGSIIFPSSEIMSSNAFTILFAAIQIVTTISSSFFVDNLNRRSFIVVSFSLAGLINSCTAFLYYMQHDLFESTVAAWLIFLSVTLYSIVYQFVYPALFLIRSELFPLSVRAVGTSFCRIGISITSFAMIKMFLHIYSNYGIHYNFLIFSLSSWMLVAFVYFTLPETRNRTLIEIQEALEKQK